MDVFFRARNASRVGASVPAYGTGFTRLSLHIAVSACRPTYLPTYLPFFDNMDVFPRALNASRVDYSIPAYGTGFYTSLSLSLCI